jgi:hypothetical protein
VGRHGRSHLSRGNCNRHRGRRRAPIAAGVALAARRERRAEPGHFERSACQLYTAAVVCPRTIGRAPSTACRNAGAISIHNTCTGSRVSGKDPALVVAREQLEHPDTAATAAGVGETHETLVWGGCGTAARGRTAAAGHAPAAVVVYRLDAGPFGGGTLRACLR